MIPNNECTRNIKKLPFYDSENNNEKENLP